MSITPILIVPIVLVVMYFAKKYKPPQPIKNQVECDRTELPSRALSPKVKYCLIALLSLSMSTFAGMEMAYISYSCAYYQVIPIHFSAKTAAELNSVMSATLTAGKLMSAFISIKLRPEIMIAYSFVIIAISLVIFYVGVSTSWALWLGNALIGLGYSGVWSSYFSLADNYVGLSNRVSSILQGMAAICPMISPFIFGPLIEKKPQIFLSLQFVYYILSIVSFAAIVLIARKHMRSEKMIIRL